MTGLTATAEQLRREGMIDALTLLAMRGRRRQVTVEDLLEQLGHDLVDRFTEAEVRASLRRWKARSAARQGATKATVHQLLTKGTTPTPSAPVSTETTCPLCGTRFDRPDRRRSPFCSDECRHKAHLNRQRASRAKKAEGRPVGEVKCDCCGDTWPSARALNIHQAQLERAKARASCPECGKELSALGLGPHRAKAHGIRGER